MRIGIVGSGMIGSSLAGGWAKAGHQVALSNSRGPDSLRDLEAELGPNVRAATVADAVRDAEVVVVAVPLKAVADLAPEDFAGKLVIDTTNYYPERDGHVAELDAGTVTSSELNAAHLDRSRIVKAFNTIYFERIRGEGRPAGAPDRQVVFMAGDARPTRRP